MRGAFCLPSPLIYNRINCYRSKKQLRKVEEFIIEFFFSPIIFLQNISSSSSQPQVFFEECSLKLSMMEVDMSYKFSSLHVF